MQEEIIENPQMSPCPSQKSNHSKQKENIQSQANTNQYSGSHNLKTNNANIESTMNSYEVPSEINNNQNDKDKQKSVTKVKPKKSKKKIPVTNRIVPESEILSGPLLSIEEGNNTSILNHNKLMINPGGLLGGRKNKDGVTYFTLSTSPEESNGSIYTDFALNLKIDEKKAETVDDFIFIIFYKVETKNYFIKFSDNDKINEEIMLHLIGNMQIPLNHTEMIFFGKQLFQLKPNNKTGSIKVIKLSEKENQNDNAYEFSYKNDTITIGRGENCDIYLSDCEADVSKVQCSLQYSAEDKQWMLRDGTGEKKSTNGTWLICSHSYPLYNDMEIEIFSNVLKVNYY